MKNLYKLRMALTLFLLVAGMATALAQNPLTTPVGDLYKQGTNSGDLVGPAVAGESPDLITKGTTVPYLVVPDPILNSGWAPGGDATNTTGINSTWTWTVPGTIGTINATPDATGHYINVKVTGNAATTGTINVKEQGDGSCPDPTGTNIDVKIVAQPTASALAVTDGTAPLTSICVNGNNGSLNVAIPTFKITNVTDASIGSTPAVKVTATLSFTDFVTATPSDVIATPAELSVDASGNISNADITTASGGSFTALNRWGTYTLTVYKISDKISRKDVSAAGGYFDVNGATGLTATYSVLKTASTGAIYHLPNNL